MQLNYYLVSNVTKLEKNTVKFPGYFCITRKKIKQSFIFIILTIASSWTFSYFKVSCSIIDYISHSFALKVVPSLIKYRNDINEIEYIDSSKVSLKVTQTNFCKARVRMRKVISILIITYLTRSLMVNLVSSTVILKL